MPHQDTVFMAGTQPAQDSTIAVAMISGLVVATASGEGGPVRPPTQVLSDLLDALTTLLTAEVNPVNQTQHNADVAKLRDEITQAKEELTRRTPGWQQSEPPCKGTQNDFRQRAST